MVKTNRYLGLIFLFDLPRTFKEQKCSAQCALTNELFFHVNGKYLQSDSASFQLRQPEFTKRIGDAALLLMEHAEQKVIVAIGHRYHFLGHHILLN